MSTATSSLKASGGGTPVSVPAELHFAAGIPGFPKARRFVVRPWGGDKSPFCVLDCRDVLGLRFVVVGPGVFFPWYQPLFSADVYGAVDASGPHEVLVLVILTLRSRPEDTTANLLGPVVVNVGNGQAVQAVLSGSGYEPQVPLRPPS